MADDISASPQTAGGPLMRFLYDGVRYWGASVMAFVTGGSAGAWTLSPVSSSNPLPVSPGQAPTVDDGTIAAGGTAQALFGGITPPNGFEIINASDSAELFASDSITGPADGVAGTIPIDAHGTYATPPGRKPAGPIHVNGGTTGQAFTARCW